jgi:hypothetical protein
MRKSKRKADSSRDERAMAKSYLLCSQMNGFRNDRPGSFAVLKQLLNNSRELLEIFGDLLGKFGGLLERARKWNAHEDGAPDRVGYTSVPFWRPWRDF